MRKISLGSVLLAAAVLSGCRLDWPMLKHEHAVNKPGSVAAVKPAPPPVTADQVTEANAQALAQALEDEIARDEERPR